MGENPAKKRNKYDCNVCGYYYLCNFPSIFSWFNEIAIAIHFLLDELSLTCACSYSIQFNMQHELSNKRWLQAQWMKGGGRYQQLHLNCNIKVEISQFRMFCNAIEHKYIFIFPGRLALGVNCILSTEYSFWHPNSQLQSIDGTTCSLQVCIASEKIWFHKNLTLIRWFVLLAADYHSTSLVGRTSGAS